MEAAVLGPDLVALLESRKVLEVRLELLHLRLMSRIESRKHRVFGDADHWNVNETLLRSYDIIPG